MSVPGEIPDHLVQPASAVAPNGSTVRGSRFSFVMLAAILLVTALVAFLPPDGRECANWMQFIGRFHPLVIHFPIALFLLVPIFELVGRTPRFGHLRLASEVVLALATLAATAAAFSGWFLGRSGGYSGSLVI